MDKFSTTDHRHHVRGLTPSTHTPSPVPFLRRSRARVVQLANQPYVDLTMLGATIAIRRRAKGCTLPAFAKRVGLSRRTLAKIECGERVASTEVLSSIARELEVPVGDLVEAAA